MVLTVLLNLLQVVFPCKNFPPIYKIFSNIYFYIYRIFFPLLGDQPTAAIHVTENLHAAFELFQVRSGDGLKPLHRNGITPEGSREAVGVEVRQTIDLNVPVQVVLFCRADGDPASTFETSRIRF